MVPVTEFEVVTSTNHFEPLAGFNTVLPAVVMHVDVIPDQEKLGVTAIAVE